MAGYAVAALPVAVDHKADSKAAQPVAVIKNAGNKICPISGDKIVFGQEVKVVYKGIEYNLCCAMCVKDFYKDPEKAIKILKDKGEIK